MNIPALVKKVTSLRPVRVFTHFGQSNGAILAGGVTYQAIFAIFAAIWLVFSIAGLWLADNPVLEQKLFDVINQSVPGLIGTGGVIDPNSLTSAGVLGWTGAIALVGLLFTTLGWLSSTATAIRAIFKLPPVTTFFLLVKLRELGLGIGFGLALVVSALISLASTAALGWVFDLVNIPQDSLFYTVLVRVIGLLIVLLIDTVTLAALYRLLSQVRIPLKNLLVGSLLGAIGLGVLKLLGNALLGGASSNPLIATFATIIGLLIWFNLTSTITLIAAAWIAVGMEDAGIPAVRISDEQRTEELSKREADAVAVIAEADLRHARQAFNQAPWYRKNAAKRRLQKATRKASETRPN